MFHNDLEQLRKHILKTGLLGLPEELQNQLIRIAPAIPDGLCKLYKPKQTFSCTVLPHASLEELFIEKLRNGVLDESYVEAGIEQIKQTGAFKLSLGDREKAKMKERRFHSERLQALKHEKDSGFCRFLDNRRVQKYVRNLSSVDLSILLRYVESRVDATKPYPLDWDTLHRKMILSLHGGAIHNLAYRINSICKMYVRSSPNEITLAERRYRISIPAAPTNVSLPVWKCAHWLAAVASPEKPFTFDVNTIFRDRIIALNDAMQRAARYPVHGNQQSNSALSHRLAVAITR